MSRKPPASAPDRAKRETRGAAGRRLTAEEQSLWDAVAKSVRRSFGASKNPPAPGHSTATASPPALRPVEPPKPGPAGKPASARTPAPPPAIGAQRPPEPKTRIRGSGASIDPLGRNTPGLDRRTSRRLSKGEREPEDSIDLHGMTAERAHGALIGFIRSQQARGARCVLVITGKGGRGEDALGGWRTERAGILRTMAPEWLRQPPLAGLVTAVYQAHRRHGGDGALYVYLRKNR